MLYSKCLFVHDILLIIDLSIIPGLVEVELRYSKLKSFVIMQIYVDYVNDLEYYLCF